MDVCTYDFSDSSCKEVPDDDPAIVATHSQESAPAVEGACEGHADAVQSAISLLSKLLNKHNAISYSKYKSTSTI